MNSFCVTFNTGFYGTWLVWFISQHRGFAPVNVSWRYNHFNTMTKGSKDPIHLQIHGHEWTYDDRRSHTMEYDEEDTEIELKEYIMLHHEYEKFCYKINPHHHFDHCNDSNLRNLVTANGSYICCGFLTNQDIVADRLHKWSWDWAGQDNSYEYIAQANGEANYLARLTDGLLIDMGALLGPNDSLSHVEYFNLLEFIQAPAIKEWRGLLVKAIR